MYKSSYTQITPAKTDLELLFEDIKSFGISIIYVDFKKPSSEIMTQILSVLVSDFEFYVFKDKLQPNSILFTDNKANISNTNITIVKGENGKKYNETMYNIILPTKQQTNITINDMLAPRNMLNNLKIGTVC